MESDFCKQCVKFPTAKLALIQLQVLVHPFIRTKQGCTHLSFCDGVGESLRNSVVHVHPGLHHRVWSRGAMEK